MLPTLPLIQKVKSFINESQEYDALNGLNFGTVKADVQVFL